MRRTSDTRPLASLGWLSGSPATLPTMNRKIDRRQALGALGVVSLGGLLSACGHGDDTSGSVRTSMGETSTVETKTTPSTGAAAEFDSSATCRVATELTEGPYYFDVDSIRSDLREDREGTLLRLGVRVRDADSCEPIENGIVDVWHCDAGDLLRLRVGVDWWRWSRRRPGRVEPLRRRDLPARRAGDEQRRHRRVQDDLPRLVPGATHIHVKVHLNRRTVLTTQLFTNRDFDAKVYARKPYAQDSGRDTFNHSDGIYARSGEFMLSMRGEAVRGLITLDVERS